MPGGLTRIAASADIAGRLDAEGGRQQGHLGPLRRPGQHVQPAARDRPAVELSRGGGDLPSRAADNLFWLGRYVERAEGVVRLLRGILVRLTEQSGLAEVPELPVLLRALTDQTETYPGFLGDGAGRARSRRPRTSCSR